MRIAITQRIDFIQDRNEFRDSIDQNLIKLLSSLGHIPLMVPNVLIEESNTLLLQKFLNEYNPEGVIISGGNDVGQYLSRDITEKFICSWANKLELPILGICRGMQLIGSLYGSKLQKIEGHISKNHKVFTIPGREVLLTNSYHAYCLDRCPDNFMITHYSEDGVIEGIKHINKEIYGIMWHPERNSEVSYEDTTILRTIFG